MELAIPAAPAQLAGLRQAARHALREVPSQIADELVLALDEAATNAILYGSRGGDPVQVALWVRGGWVEATVVDHGPAQPPHPPPTTDQLSSPVGGCGCLTAWSRRSGWSAPSSARR
jgi:anti-sigma regulatory factor (Ser/Thr protein kinase)